MVREVSIHLFSCLTFTAHLLAHGNQITVQVTRRNEPEFPLSADKNLASPFGQECLQKVRQLLSEAILFYQLQNGAFAAV